MSSLWVADLGSWSGGQEGGRPHTPWESKCVWLPPRGHPRMAFRETWDLNSGRGPPGVCHQSSIMGDMVLNFSPRARGLDHSVSDGERTFLSALVMENASSCPAWIICTAWCRRPHQGWLCPVLTSIRSPLCRGAALV